MSKSNWKGTSGWGAINDPTGVLSGRCLVASSGLTTQTEDYLLTVVGTTTTMSATSYSVYTDYAWPNYNETHPFMGGTLGLIARSTNFQGDPQSAYSCYIAKLNVEQRKVQICRRVRNKETILVDATMPNTSISRGAKHTMEFRCYGKDQVTLQLLLDSTIVANVGDINDSKLTGGVPGIQVKNGTVYLDTFTVSQYTQTGTSPSLWNPNNITGVTIASWYKADLGVTVTGSTVTAWSDSSANSNTMSAAGVGNEPVEYKNALNNYSIIKFDGTNDFLSAADSATLDLITNGYSIFIINSPTDPAVGNNPLLVKDLTYSLGYVSTVGLSMTGDSNSHAASFTGVTNTYQMSEAITDKLSAGTGGLFLDGSKINHKYMGAGADNANELLMGKNGSSQFFKGDIAEVILVNGECNEENRQLIEGYLAHKYATWVRLPTSHPYYSYAPIVQE